MVLTRLGKNSKMIISADPDQSDIGEKSKIEIIASRLQKIDNIELHTFSDEDCVRHPLIKDIVNAFKEMS